MTHDINIHIEVPGLPELAEALKALVAKAQQKVAEMSEPQKEEGVLLPHRDTKDGNIGMTYLRRNYGISQKWAQAYANSKGIINHGTTNNPRYEEKDIVRILRHFGKIA